MFTAVINCFNEELYIQYALKSIYKYCTEIVVVDNASSDQSIALIEKFIDSEDHQKKIKLYKFNEPQQLAFARNFALDQVTNEWVIKWDGDFCAFDTSDDKYNSARPFDELMNLISQTSEDYDLFLLYSINVCGDMYHCDKSRKYLGLSGDSFVGRKDCMRYVADNLYGDIGYLRRPNGEIPRFYYSNNPEKDPIYFVHLYGVKPDEYLLYRMFMSEYQVWLSKDGVEKIDFWTWMDTCKSYNVENGLSYINKQLVENLEKHNYPLPRVLDLELEMPKFEIIYDDGHPIYRKSNI